MADIQRRHIVIGTAGHIDHGKSALVKALTGVDPDRLKEEKERGMTTDLGFVFYGDNATIIDVPGHEKFVRHMVAGASTVDIVMFVVAADDGIMPQTYEHLEILKLLAIKKGVVVISKKDMVKPDRLQIVINDIKDLMAGSFLENAPFVAVSNITSDGIDELKKILNNLIAETEAKLDRGIFRMGIDRCFSIKGFGTVVAGTVLSGKTKLGDELELLPEKKKVKIRGIEVHNKQVNEVGTGFRAAINLVGAEKEEIERGDVLAQPGFFEPSLYLNASLFLLTSVQKPLKNFARLRIHLGTKEILGRVVFLDKKVLQSGEKAMVQFRLESPAVASINDQYVIRTYSPQVTIGGGTIIEVAAVKVKGYDEDLLAHLERVETAAPIVLVEEDLLSSFELPKKTLEIAKDINLPVSDVKEMVNKLVEQKKVLCLDAKRELYYHEKNIETLKQKIIEQIKEFHKQNPTSIGIPALELLKKISPGLDKFLLDTTLNGLEKQGVVQIAADKKIRLTEFKPILEKAIDENVQKIEKILLAQGFQPLDFKEVKTKLAGKETDIKKAYQYLLDNKILINIGEGLVLHQQYVKQAETKLIDFLKKNKEIRISQFRDLLNASRRAVLPLLIYFDTRGITIRREDVRVLSSKHQ
ncbi:MAG: selenocysteine-specific translation elongation factor [Candidatus Latescibacteria bacterium]|nr:selenocysteine-specific translation elongation factor [Candidatus Latescibacterota bacterium]